MKDEKVKILVDEGSLMTAPGAIIEVYDSILVGGIAARGGGWHVYPHYAWAAKPLYTQIIYAKSVEELKNKISRLYPESRYILEYL